MSKARRLVAVLLSACFLSVGGSAPVAIVNAPARLAPLSVAVAPLARPRLPVVLPGAAQVGPVAAGGRPAAGPGSGGAADPAATSPPGSPAVRPPSGPVPAAPWVPPAWLPSRLLVVYYGNPFNGRMGILGQGTPAAMLARLRRQVAAYQALTKRRVQPALDLVTVVAQGSPQPHGTYRLRMPPSLVDREVELARRNHMPIFLDVQIGRSTVPAEVYALAPYLRLPWVNLALDPEFAMSPGELPGRQIGSMHASAINWAIDYLAGLVARDGLPDKVLIVHQWTAGMVPDWQKIRPRAGVQLVMDMDGFGGQQIKRHNYGLFVRQEPIPGRFGAIKLFYTQDHPLFSPAQVMALQPTPSVVLYQ